MKKSIIVLLMSFIFLSCTKKNNVTEIVENQEIQETVVLEEVQDEIIKEPVYVKQFTEEDRYFSLDGGYMTSLYSGLYGLWIKDNILTYEINEDVKNFTDTEQKISFINKNGIDYIQLSKKFPKELTPQYIYEGITDIATDDKILYLIGNTENLGKLIYAYTRGFDTTPITDNSVDEPFIFYKDASSYLVENKKEYKVENLNCKLLETPWIEGVPGDGIGEGFTFSFNAGLSPTLLLINGYISFEKPYLYEQNNRIKKIKVKGLTSGKEKILDVIDTPHPQTVDISFITEVEDIRVEIADVYKGTKYDDTCLQYCTVFYETVIPYKSK